MGRLLTLAASLMALCVGCTFLDFAAPPCPPSWVEHPPSDSVWAMGVGQCGPTYLPQDAQNTALARALNELAAQAGIAVESETLLLQKLEGAHYVEQWTQQINTRVEGLIEGFEIVEHHHCSAGGEHRSAEGTTYVLIRIRRSAMMLRSR
ncbi:MAG: hypothetical protein ACI9EF_001984 [Pseudohongiellaceae bacterium]|jgi:hypothetical protein